MKSKKALKIALISLTSVILAIVLTLGGYVTYVFAAYYRLEDKLVLEVDKADGASSVPVGEELRMVSYNIGFGAYSDDYTFFMDGGDESRCRSEQIGIENVKGALSVANNADADIYLFQEVDIDATRSYHVNQLDILKESLGGEFASVYAQNYDSPYLFWPLLEPHGANKSGIATFSRFDVSSALRRQLPIEDGFMKLLDLDRCYSVSRIPCEGGRELVVYNVHLSAYTSDGTIANEQLKMLIADMQGEYDKGNYCIAGGDFNKDLPDDTGDADYTWAQPIPPEIIPEDFTLIPPEADPIKSCRDAGVVYDADTSFTIPVDGFIVSNNVEVKA